MTLWEEDSHQIFFFIYALVKVKYGSNVICMLSFIKNAFYVFSQAKCRYVWTTITEEERMHWGSHLMSESWVAQLGYPALASCSTLGGGHPCLRAMYQRHWCCQKCLVHMWCYIQPGKHLMVSQSSQHQRATAWKSPDRLVHPHDTMQRAVPGPWMQCSFTTMLPCMLCSHVRFVLCSIILCRHTRHFHHTSS